MPAFAQVVTGYRAAAASAYRAAAAASAYRAAAAAFAYRVAAASAYRAAAHPGIR